MFIVSSDRTSVDITECQTAYILPTTIGIKYKINQYPGEVDIKTGETSMIEHGYGSGFGDLWSWSYFFTLSKDEAESYRNVELKRVSDKYLNKVDTVEVPIDIIKGIYRIMCGVSRPVSGEVYPEAIPGMNKACDWIIKYGRDNKIDPRGFDEKKSLPF